MWRRLGIVIVVVGAAAAACRSERDAVAQSLPDASAVLAGEDVIAARQALMVAMEDLMRPIDTYTVDESIDPDLMRTDANAIAAMLLTVPSLFPPNTNLYDPEAELPETLALPAVWQSFAGFVSLARAAATAATGLAESEDESLHDRSLALRGACDACHAGYLLPYEPPSVSEEELDIDFDF